MLYSLKKFADPAIGGADLVLFFRRDAKMPHSEHSEDQNRNFEALSLLNYNILLVSSSR